MTARGPCWELQVSSYIAAAASLLNFPPTDLLASKSLCSKPGKAAKGCRPCNCFAPGSKNAVCNKNTGACVCKEFVQGQRCGLCKDGFSTLSSGNPFGCSGDPGELAAPTLTEVAGPKIKVAWGAPKVNGGPVTTYQVIRDGKSVFEVKTAASTARAFVDDDVTAGTSYVQHTISVTQVLITRAVAVPFGHTDGRGRPVLCTRC